jgi:uncharacterized protein DUF4166
VNSGIAERSPWEAALGDSLEQLHPRLRAYFSPIPAGHVGRGAGTFAVVGTPRRWLWPVLWLLGLDGVVFPVWEHEVPFTVENRWQAGVLRGIRTFEFRGAPRVMTDAIIAEGDMIIDRIGRHGRIESTLSPSVVDGALILRSTATRLRLGRLRMPLPLAPRVDLREEATADRQRVTLVMTAPLVGRIYEYTGDFDYVIVPDLTDPTERIAG